MLKRILAMLLLVLSFTVATASMGCVKVGGDAEDDPQIESEVGDSTIKVN